MLPWVDILGAQGRYNELWHWRRRITQQLLQVGESNAWFKCLTSGKLVFALVQSNPLLVFLLPSTGDLKGTWLNRLSLNHLDG